MQDWKIVNFSKYSLSCCTYVFHRCRFVLAFSVLAHSSSGTFVFRRPRLAFSVAPLACRAAKTDRGAVSGVNSSRPKKLLGVLEVLGIVPGKGDLAAGDISRPIVKYRVCGQYSQSYSVGGSSDAAF